MATPSVTTTPIPSLIYLFPNPLHISNIFRAATWDFGKNEGSSYTSLANSIPISVAFICLLHSLVCFAVCIASACIACRSVFLMV